jgi:hypothetical protein
MIEPSYLDPSVMAENLLINRESGIIRRNVPALPTSTQETVMYIYGIFGLCRLYSGTFCRPLVALFTTQLCIL